MRARRISRVWLAPLLGLALLGISAPVAQGALSWDRASYDFGNQEVGISSAPHTFTLTATCDADAGAGVCMTPAHSYGSVTAPGVDFGVDSTTCTGLLTTPTFPGTASCIASVTFKPSSIGPKSGVLDTATGPDVALSGTGVEPGGSKDGAKKCKKKKKKGKSSASAAKKKKKKCKKKKKKR